MSLRSKNMQSQAPARFEKHQLKLNAQTAAASGQQLGIVCTKAGRVADLLVGQSTAGDGTSWTVDVKKNGTSVLTTLCTLTAAIGANKALDAGSQLSALSGCTRPVLKTDSTVLVAVGDLLTVDITKSGTYSTGWSGEVILLLVDSTDARTKYPVTGG